MVTRKRGCFRNLATSDLSSTGVELDPRALLFLSQDQSPAVSPRELPQDLGSVRRLRDEDDVRRANIRFNAEVLRAHRLTHVAEERPRQLTSMRPGRQHPCAGMVARKAIDHRLEHRDNIEITKSRFAIPRERLRPERPADHSQRRAGGDKLQPGPSRKIEKRRGSKDIEKRQYGKQISREIVEHREGVS